MARVTWGLGGGGVAWGWVSAGAGVNWRSHPGLRVGGSGVAQAGVEVAWRPSAQ